MESSSGGESGSRGSVSEEEGSSGRRWVVVLRVATVDTEVKTRRRTMFL